MASIKVNEDQNGRIISYRVRICLGRDELGHQILKSMTFPPPDGLTPSKAMKEIAFQAAEWEREERAGFVKPAERNMTLAEFITRHWLPDAVRDGDHKATTIQFYENISKLILGYFGDKIKIAEITPEMVIKFTSHFKKLEVNGRPRFSASTRLHIYRTMDTILEYARITKYIKENPCTYLPKSQIPKRNRHEVDYLTVGQLRQFRSALDDAPIMWRLYFSLLMFCALRRGEGLGLQWGDIDYDGMRLRICRNVTRNPDQPHSTGVGSTKTDAVRYEPLTPTLMAMLDEYHAEQVKAYGSIDAENYIFCAPADPTRPMYPTTPTTWLSRFIKKMNLPDFSPHDLRHTVATLLVQNHTDPKTTQQILGHSDVSTTLTYYTGVDLGRLRTAVNGLEKMVIEEVAKDCPVETG